MDITRKIGAVVLVLGAVGVWFAMAPENGVRGNVVDKTTNSAIDGVLLDDSFNQNTAKSAPQQQVVNGWTARDLLEVIARQGAVRDDRPAALVGLGVFGLALFLFTFSRSGRAGAADFRDEGTDVNGDREPGVCPDFRSL